MIQSIENGMIYFLSLVPAGFPSPAADYVQEVIDLNKFFKVHSPSRFMVRVIGDSMIGALITDNSLLMVDRAIIPQHNSIVVATVNGEQTVKRYSSIDGIISLVPANPKYKPIVITEGMTLEVEGVVTEIITSTKYV